MKNSVLAAPSSTSCKYLEGCADGVEVRADDQQCGVHCLRADEFGEQEDHVVNAEQRDEHDRGLGQPPVNKPQRDDMRTWRCEAYMTIRLVRRGQNWVRRSK